MLLTSLYFSRGDRSPLDTPSVPEKPPGIPPSPLHGRDGRAAAAVRSIVHDYSASGSRSP